MGDYILLHEGSPWEGDLELFVYQVCLVAFLRAFVACSSLIRQFFQFRPAAVCSDFAVTVRKVDWEQFGDADIYVSLSDPYPQYALLSIPFIFSHK